MKRLFALFCLILPLLIMGFFWLVPEADGVASRPLLHFYIVTFTTFAAVVLSILLSYTLGSQSERRHVITAVAFAAMGAIFFLHGVTTPGALIAGANPIVVWSAWLTLFVGGALFAIASADDPNGPPAWLSVRGVVYGTIIGVGAYIGIALFRPAWLTAIELRAAPWHRASIATATLILWLVAAWRLGRIWHTTRSRVDATLAFISLWMAQATISLHQFELWQYSWWLYHFLLLGGFLIATYILMAEYEQTRQFRLMPYYVAGSLIVTALLALVASDLYARFSYNTAASQLTDTYTEMLDQMTRSIDQTLPEDAAPADIQRAMASRLPAASPSAYFLVYDRIGGRMYPPGDDGYPAAVTVSVLQEFVRALQGEIVVSVLSQADAPSGYLPGQNGYFVTAFAPFYGPSAVDEPMGVVQVVQAAPELTEILLRSRNAGLGISALTMTLLFVALYFVVQRANRIMQVRADELQHAYADLRRSEAMRDDLTQMIVHDLRNPLTSISASLDLLNVSDGNGVGGRSRFIKMARDGTQRLQNLIDDILTVSKFETGEVRLAKRPTLIEEIINERQQSFAGRAAVEEKSLTADYPSDLGWELDPDLIGRVLDNLLSNAFKYTRAGEGEIQILVRSQPGLIRFVVCDNGEGVPDAYKEQIFDKYSQVVDDSGVSLRQGTGLGLTFCRMVIEAHGGEIFVEDAPGGGSRFVFWLPPAGAATYVSKRPTSDGA